MKLALQRRLAAEILGVGETRIWIDPDRTDEVTDAITYEDIRRLIKEGAIRKRPSDAPSRARARKRQKKRRKRRRGPGSRKGSKGEIPWHLRIRAIRRELKRLRDNKMITPKMYRDLYRKAKGGFFTSVRHLRRYVQEHNLLVRGEL